jgi:RNA polymerase sigma-70 factor (ECF subfamily)
MDPAEDEELMLASGRGDRAAFAQLVRRHLGRSNAIAVRVLGSAAEAEEVVQEAFLRVWQKAPSWRKDGGARVSTWLARVIVNLCIDRRRRARSVPLEEVPEMPDPSPRADETLALEERRQRVAAALAELPDRQRAAVVLSYYEGLSNAEVAGALEISIGAVESLLVRARRSLAGLLADLARTEGALT